MTEELSLYMKEVGRHKLLTTEQEVDLVKRVAQGEQEARDALIKSNLRLVISLAKRYKSPRMSLGDLVAEGNMGLFTAISKFSLDRGCKFSTYATWWIKQSIRRAIVNKANEIRVPAYLQEIVSQWKNKKEELKQKRGVDPSPEEIRKSLKISKQQAKHVEEALACSGTQSESESYGEVPGTSIFNTVACKKETPLQAAENKDERDHRKEFLRTAMEKVLKEKERTVLSLRFGLDGEGPFTLEIIGKRLGLTRERIRQIECTSLKKLERFMKPKEDSKELTLAY